MCYTDGNSVVRTDDSIRHKFEMRTPLLGQVSGYPRKSVDMVGHGTGDDNHAHLPVSGRPGERLEYVDIMPLALLDEPRACSGRSKGYARMSTTPQKSRNRPC